MKPNKMSPKSSKKPTASVVRVPSATRHLDEGDETEITAQVSIPEEGGWGWVVMVTSFLNICLIDGVIFTFGALYTDIRDDLKINESLVNLINSFAYALYFIGGPIASAIINRFGFRECTMTGSVIVCCSLLGSYYAPNYGLVLLTYGMITGFGACLINMPSNLVVGFYFEKLRSLVMSISASGSSGGVMIFYPLNTYVCGICGWRILTLFHAGMIGLVYFFGMTYKPLISLFITKTTDEGIPTVTYIPKTTEEKSATAKKGEMPTVAERMFHTVSSARYPTAEAVIEEGVVTPAHGAQAGTSTVSSAKIKVTAHAPASVSQKQLKSIHDMLSHAHLPDKANKNMPMEINVEIKPPEKRSWWKSCCQWEKNDPGARPMYRDDAFYAGKVENLPAYKKSVANIAPESRTGLEYQMAVTRAATAADINEKKRGVFTTAFKRILVTMVDPRLLRRCSFLFLCLSAFCTCVGLLIPYVFLSERNRLLGMAPEHCTNLVSVIGFTNLIGRLILGAIACKVDPLIIYMLACMVSGLAAIASTFNNSLYYQYALASVYGFFIASLVSLRSLVLVKLYGLDMLTNATGLMVMFQGLGGLISTPTASMIKSLAGFNAAFYFAGIFISISGLVLIPVQMLVKREDRATANLAAQLTSKKRQNELPPPSPPPPLPTLSEEGTISQPSSRVSNTGKTLPKESNILRPRMR